MRTFLRQLDPLPLRLRIWRWIRHTHVRLQYFRGRCDIRSADAHYCREAPSNHNAVDIFRGTWTSAFPDESQVRAGSLHVFDDSRVQWAAAVLPGGLRGLSIVDLGAYEGYAAWQMEQLGARAVTAVEGSDINFLKLLVVKEVTGLKARALFGDIDRYLDTCTGRFDLVWASGILYHSTDPVGLLRRLTRVSDRIFIHTHYFDSPALQANPYAMAFFEPARNRVERVGDRSLTLHFRPYGHGKRGRFCGGPEEHSYWMEKEDIFAVLSEFGFAEVSIGVDHPANPNGPAMYFLATRASSQALVGRPGIEPGTP